MIAKSLGAKKVVAFVRSPDFAEDSDYIKSQFGISHIINPEYDTAKEISRIIRLPISIKLEAFFSSDTTVAELTVNDKIISTPEIKISDLRKKFDVDILISTVKRGKDVFVPNGDFTLKIGDVINVVSSQNELKKFCESLGIIRKPIKSVMMVGCGTIGLYLAKELCEHKIKLKIIEFSQKRCAELLDKLPNAEIVYGDGVESDLLIEEEIHKFDACVALTGADETNLVISMFAWSCGIHPIITKIVSASYAEILKGVNIDYTVSPALATAHNVLRYIRHYENGYMHSFGDINAIEKIADGKIEYIEFVADSNFSKRGKPLTSEELKLKPNTLISAILRGGKVIIPDGKSTILDGDRVIVVTSSKSGFCNLEEIFK
jgi:trk system potassium uptake protein TrkA